MFRLPPPDPNECSEPAAGFAVPEPTAVFLGGTAPADGDPVADRFLDLRPGVLLVLARD